MDSNSQPKPQKHVPLRTCIVTREKLPKNELMRIVRQTNDDGSFSLSVDLRGKKSGRGANIKPDLEVLQVALDKGHLSRALQLQRALTPDEKSQLIAEFQQAMDEKSFRPRNQKIKLKISRDEFKRKLAESEA